MIVDLCKMGKIITPKGCHVFSRRQSMPSLRDFWAFFAIFYNPVIPSGLQPV
jgi:hypothetical protein